MKMMSGCGWTRVTTSSAFRLLQLGTIVRMKHYETAVSLLRQMEFLGIYHDVYTLSILLNCFCGLHRVGFGFSVLGRMLKLGLQPVTVTFNTLIYGLCIGGKVAQAVRLFDDMVREGTIIDSLCKDKLVTEALNLISEMTGQWKEVMTLLNEMLANNCKPNVITYTLLVDALCKEGKISEAHDIVERMIQHGVQPNTITYSALMDGYCLQGQMYDARKVLNLMIIRGCVPDVYSYNIMVNGYCKYKRVNEAMELFREMSQNGPLPNTVTYTALINGMARLGLCKAGLENEAYKLFRKMEVNGCVLNSCTYNVLIQGFLLNNDISTAAKILPEMVVNKEIRCFRDEDSDAKHIDKLLWPSQRSDMSMPLL
ncbi:hypothetical protein CRYUN_Cryun01aG0007100 [Craigia yunnanensis]